MTSTTVSRPSRPDCSAGIAAFGAVLLCAGGLARADDVEKTLGDVRAATGVVHLSEHAGGLRLTGRAEFLGQDASYSLLFDGSGNYLQEIVAPVGITTGYDGTTAWVRDLGGETREQVLGDRSSNLLSSAILTGSWLHQSQELGLSIDSENSDPAITRLKFSYDQGRLAGHVDIDRATSLPRRWIIDSGRNSLTLDIVSWTEFGGMKLPTQVTIESSSGLKITTRSDSVKDAPAFVRNPYAPVFSPPPDAHFEAGAPPALEVRKAPSGHLLVHPKVDGKDLGWFIFDTGAGSSVLNNASAEALGLKPIGSIPATGVGSSVPAGVFRATTLTLGPLTIDKPMLVGLNLTFLNGPMGVEVAGIIGYGLLARSVAEIDMTGASIALYDPAVYQLHGAEWSKLAVYERVPTVEASFEGHTGFFKLDTGAGNSTVTIHAPAVERLKLLEGRTVSPSVLGGVGGSVPAAVGPLEWFEIGGRRKRKVVASFATQRAAAFADEYTLGNIGGKLLAPFMLVLDYQHSRIGFVPKAAKPAAESPASGN